MMKATTTTTQEILALLAKTPQQLTSLVGEFDRTHIYSPSGQMSVTVSEIVAHLRACSDVLTFGIFAMLTEERPILPEINERKWAKVTAYARLPLALSLQAFSFQRQELLRVLRPLPLEGWDREMLSTDGQHTVFSQAQNMALHEQSHLEQMAEIMKKT